jgi:heme/copper-type cytochrome/quinol oxidase subunit 2
MKRLISGLPLFFTAATLLAQSASPDDTGAMASVTPEVISDKAAAGIVAGACGLMLIPILISVAIWLWIAIWIMKDSARRQSPNRTLVVVLGWLVPIVGLIVHLATRPKTIPGAPNP